MTGKIAQLSALVLISAWGHIGRLGKHVDFQWCPELLVRIFMVLTNVFNSDLGGGVYDLPHLAWLDDTAKRSEV